MKRKKKSDLAILLDYAGNYKGLTFLGLGLSGVAMVLGMLPYLCIWLVARDLIAVAPHWTRATEIARYGWMAFAFASVDGVWMGCQALKPTTLPAGVIQPVCVGRIEPKHITKSLVPHFTDDTLLVSDGHSAYKSVANKEGIPLRQIPSNKHESGGYHLGHVNGYHHNLSVFLYRYHGVSTKYLKNYLTLFNWKEKHKNLTYQEQAYEIINLLSKQVNKIPLKKFKDIPQIIDMKGILDHPQMA